MQLTTKIELTEKEFVQIIRDTFIIDKDSALEIFVNGLNVADLLQKCSLDEKDIQDTSKDPEGQQHLPNGGNKDSGEWQYRPKDWNKFTPWGTAKADDFIEVVLLDGTTHKLEAGRFYWRALYCYEIVKYRIIKES